MKMTFYMSRFLMRHFYLIHKPLSKMSMRAPAVTAMTKKKQMKNKTTVKSVVKRKPLVDSGLRKSDNSMANFKNSSKNFKKATDNKEVPADVNKIDLLFSMDCTSSMSSYIASARSSVKGIVDEVSKSEKSDIRFGYVAYRDHPPQDLSFVTKCANFMRDPGDMKKAVSSYSAQGGGDGPEAVTAALHESLNYPWREDAVKIVVLIADAPPHGLGCPGDGFPEGDPNGLDPIEIANKMAEQGIILYVVACEPSLSSYPNAHDLMEGLAQITEGRFLPLTAASLLPDVIVGGAKEEASLQKLEKFVAENVAKMEAQNMADDEVEAKLVELMKARGSKSKEVRLTDIYGEYKKENIEKTAKAKSLSSAKAAWSKLSQPSIKSVSQRAEMIECEAPVSKMYRRCKKKCAANKS